MVKIILISSVVISFIISIIINFDANSVSAFLKGSLIFGLIIFGILTLIIKLIQNIKEKNVKKAVLFGVLSIIAIMISFVGYIMFSSSACAMMVQRAHFRTNIITGQCEYGGHASCLIGDPWYYKSDCNISNEEQIEILKNSKWYEEAIEECNSICNGGSPETYCTYRTYCKDLISCDLILCD